MKKFFTILFVVFGVLFVIEMIFIAYLFIADPFGLKGIINESVPISNVDNSQVVDENPLLDSAQEKILSGLGVDIANLPTEISPELETCLTEAVGAERALEITNGATPGVLDIIKAKACL
ncbi:hypothetical protein ISR92_00300 [Patescibacteria group bacterium]|nr:hypothetical protein [Patescibacteria group bacterium]